MVRDSRSQDPFRKSEVSRQSRSRSRPGVLIVGPGHRTGVVVFLVVSSLEQSAPTGWVAPTGAESHQHGMLLGDSRLASLR